MLLIKARVNSETKTPNRLFQRAIEARSVLKPYLTMGRCVLSAWFLGSEGRSMLIGSEVPCPFVFRIVGRTSEVIHFLKALASGFFEPRTALSRPDSLMIRKLCHEAPNWSFVFERSSSSSLAYILLGFSNPRISATSLAMNQGSPLWSVT